MPIYEYVCSSCEHEFEELQRFSDPPVNTCPSCKRRGKVQRKLSPSAFVLKGGGWYKDGYSGSGNGNGGKAAGSGSSSGGEAKSGESKSGGDAGAKSDKPASSPAS